MKISEIKNWNNEIEEEITENWKNKNLFKFNPETKKQIYSIDTPPPYVNSPIHIGHAVTYCFQDFFARYRRMKGYEVLFPLGLDRNGLPIEIAAEKKFKMSPFRVGREKFVKACEELLDEASSESIDSFSRLGISFSSYNQGLEIGEIYNTDSEEYRLLTQLTFIELYKKGLIYEDVRINNWDSRLRTTISDSEIEYKDIHSMFSNIKWKIKETGEEVVIGTTRPELICSCGMVIYNPEDERYKHLENKTIVSPIYGKEIKIKSHPLADIEKGTGLVMMCSVGDLSDIQFFREQKLTLKISINQDGTMNNNSGFLEGLKVKDARDKIIEELRKRDLIDSQVEILHRTPISERSKAEIEFIEMPEFYLKQLDFLDDIKKVADDVNFFPKQSKKILDSWIGSVSIDWPISRRRYYATPIPLWYSDDKKFVVIPNGNKYCQPWKTEPPKDAEVFENKKVIGKVSDEKFNGAKWVGEERVLDTWFDSSISELNMLKCRSNPEFFNKAYPVSLRPQGKEIVRTWLYYTLLRGFLETGESCFKDVWIHQHILDNKGRKMSKSVGNVINPMEILNDSGSEALRFWSAIEGDLSKGDFICSVEKIRAEKKTLNKLLNISKFVLLFENPEKPKLMKLDKLFIDYLEVLTQKADGFYNSYDFFHPLVELRKFLWDVFASHYIELVKNRAYNQDKNFTEEESLSAKYTLHFLLDRLLLLLYPVIPQITSVIAKEKGIDLLKVEWPKKDDIDSDVELVGLLMNFNSEVWKAKRDAGVSLRAKIDSVDIPNELSDFSKDLKACHQI